MTNPGGNVAEKSDTVTLTREEFEAVKEWLSLQSDFIGVREALSILNKAEVR